MDAAIIQNSDGNFDISIAAYDVTHELGLRTAVIISLFTDARANEDDLLPGNTEERRGYWADAYSESSLGSRLWLLERAKETQETLDDAKDYTTEALQWLLDDGVASVIQVDTTWLRAGVMAVYVAVYQGSKQLYQETFEYELKAA